MKKLFFTIIILVFFLIVLPSVFADDANCQDRYKITDAGTLEENILYCEELGSSWELIDVNEDTYSITGYPSLGNALAGKYRVANSVDDFELNRVCLDGSEINDLDNNLTFDFDNYCFDSIDVDDSFRGVCINNNPLETCDGFDNDCDGEIDIDDVQDFQCIQNTLSTCGDFGYVCWDCNEFCKINVTHFNSSPRVEVSGPFRFESNARGPYNILSIPIFATCSDDDGRIDTCEFVVGDHCTLSDSTSTRSGPDEVVITATAKCGDLSSGPYSYFGQYGINVVSTDDAGGIGFSNIAIFINPIDVDPNKQAVNVYNTIPRAPVIDTSAYGGVITDDRIYIQIMTSLVYEIDPQVLKYSVKASLPNSEPTFSDDEFSTLIIHPFSVTGLNPDIENCFYAKLFDGFAQSDVSTKECIPQINDLNIQNTSTSELQWTKWIRNIDSSKELTCSFTPDDADLTDLNTVNYSISLMAQIPGSDPATPINPFVVETKSGTVQDEQKVTALFNIGLVPGKNYNYKVGTRFFCKVDVSDGFLGNTKNSYNGPDTWEPKLIWGNDTNVSTEYIEVVNSPPFYPNDGNDVKYIDRFLVSSAVQAELNDVNDADNYPDDVTQSFSYKGKIYRDFERLAIDIDDFGPPLPDNPKKFGIPLTAERNYCFKGRAFDSLEWSNVSNELCSDENPFQPSCADLSSPKLNVVLVKSSFVDKNLVFEFDISCNSSSRINENWFIGVNESSVIFDTDVVNSTSNVIDDCNITPQRLIVSTDSNLPGNYKIGFNFGGIFNGTDKYCDQTVIATVSDGRNLGSFNIPDNNFMLIILIIAVVSFILIPKKN